MSKGIVLSLFDYTAEALKPWAAAGYECHAFDIQHVDAEPTFENTQFFAGGGSISYLHADLHDFNTHKDIFMRFDGRKVVLGMAWPVCTDMAVSGAAWFASKAKADPNFQTKAVNHATICADLFDALGVPYMIENPVSVLATKWRKPDHTFHPYEFGEYIPEDQGEHPRWPEYIAPFDAYTKKTCQQIRNKWRTDMTDEKAQLEQRIQYLQTKLDAYPTGGRPSWVSADIAFDRTAIEVLTKRIAEIERAAA